MASAPQPSKPREDLTYEWYVVAALTTLYTLSYVDRTILGLLVGPIKRDLGVNDTEVGLLTGVAFSVFYTLMGLPIGRLADTKNRRNLIAAGLVVWSFFTSAGAATRSYATLFLARIGVGVGESSLSPAAYSVISDYFPKRLLGVAISVFYMGVFVGSSLALFLGGMVVQALTPNPDVNAASSGNDRVLARDVPAGGAAGLRVRSSGLHDPRTAPPRTSSKAPRVGRICRSAKPLPR